MAMTIPKVKVVTDPNKIDWSEIFIDGFKVPGVVRHTTTIGMGEYPTITIEIQCQLELAAMEPIKNQEG